MLKKIKDRQTGWKMFFYTNYVYCLICDLRSRDQNLDKNKDDTLVQINHHIIINDQY